MIFVRKLLGQVNIANFPILHALDELFREP